MRVLATGMSGHQAGRTPKNNMITVAKMIADALRDGGHDVDQRAAMWNEELGNYDVVVVGMVPPFSIAANWIYPALRLIRRCVQEGKPILLYVDDPNFYQFKNQYPSISRGIHRIFRESMYDGRPFYLNALAAKSEYQETIDWLATQTWPPMLYVAYEWGNHDAMPPINTVQKIYADPSGYAPEYPFSVPTSRERHWVIGGLIDSRPWLEKLGTTWPVEMYGNAKYNIAKLQESELVQRFAETRGVLCQPRKVTYASGWWRSRYLFAARTNSVLVGDLGDLAPLGDAYQLTIAQVEAMNEFDLDQAARAQAEVMLGIVWNKRQYITALTNALHAAMNNKVEW